MSVSHVQTRTLTDGLDRVDTLLAARRTRLEESEERHRLASCFAREPQPEFETWAFTASDYEETALVLSKRAPEILGRLQRPLTDRDFTVVGHCSLDLLFDTDPNGAESILHTLRDGTPVQGARITSVNRGDAILNENGFYARETKVVQMYYFCETEKYHEVIIDGPFVVFFVDGKLEGQNRHKRSTR